MPENDDFQLETRLTSAKGFLPYVAAAAAILGIIIIVLTMTTDIGAKLLPMDESYQAYVAPTASDGSEALALTALEQEVKDSTTLSVRGSVVNRTEFALKDVVAVVDTRDRYTLPIQKLEFPITPAELPPGQTGSFEGTATLEREIAGYTIQFQLAEEGTFVPHRDERLAIPNPAEAPAAPR